MKDVFWDFKLCPFVERFIVLCPYLGESTIRGSIVFLFVARPCRQASRTTLMFHSFSKQI